MWAFGRTQCAGYRLRSVVDDVLFLVRKCVRRATSSGSVDCVCAALNNGVALLETTFYQHLFGAVQTGYPSTTFAAEALQTAQNAYNVIQHGKASEAGPDLQRETFLTAANNAKGTADLLLDLRKGLEQEWSKTQRSEIEAGKLDNAVSQLSDVSRKMHHLASLAMESLCKTVFRPKLKTSCDAYADIAHTLTDSQLAEFEAVDPFIEQFNANLDKQIASFESVLHKENFQTLLLTVCSEVERQMERVIMKCSFNRLGGLQLDREFRQLSAYLSGIAGWTARERCARLAQIVALLNVENVEEAVELREATRTSSIARILSASDAIKVLQLRVDLPAALVQKLELFFLTSSSSGANSAIRRMISRISALNSNYLASPVLIKLCLGWDCVIRDGAGRLSDTLSSSLLTSSPISTVASSGYVSRSGCNNKPKWLT
ncbi:hypothetical protein Y032_0103g3547 [Ancylostoma ceylanicum]|uniref:Uncharacterized protein n=2 Tax=Ancylostoma ceylanicum TaxID=53326 RepID=A0A016TH00_9BILA|nr:hypothetical protein Y032_0103g3547 [Ancylostoma ceylanicum]